MKGIFRAVILTGVAAVLAGCGMDTDHHRSSLYANQQFNDLGEQIYFTGRGQNGRPLALTGGGHHMRMHGGGCVSCHGVDRQGGQRMYPFFWVVTPPLTAAALLGEHDEDSGDHADGHGDHGSYDLTTLAKALSDGVDPSGVPLDSLMPRWQLNELELHALAEYLGLHTRAAPH